MFMSGHLTRTNLKFNSEPPKNKCVILRIKKDGTLKHKEEITDCEPIRIDNRPQCQRKM